VLLTDFKGALLQGTACKQRWLHALQLQSAMQLQCCSEAKAQRLLSVPTALPPRSGYCAHVLWIRKEKMIFTVLSVAEAICTGCHYCCCCCRYQLLLLLPVLPLYKKTQLRQSFCVDVEIVARNSLCCSSVAVLHKSLSGPSTKARGTASASVSSVQRRPCKAPQSPPTANVIE
jgi:hypothetical protein